MVHHRCLGPRFGYHLGPLVFGREFMRGQLIVKDGQTWVEKFQQDGSGLIQSLTTSDGLIEIDEETTKLEQGSLVNFLPFSYWGL